MRPATVPATAPPTALPERPSILATLGRILAMAAPFAIGATITSGLHLGKIAMLARAPDTGALQTLSLLQPAFVVLLAVMEGLAITNQVFGARSKRNWPRHGIVASSLVLSLVGLALVGLLAALAYGVARTIALDDPAMADALRWLPLFVLSFAPFLVFDVYQGAMRGQGRIVASLAPFLGLVVVDLGVTWLLVDRWGWGFEAVLAGNAAGAAAALPIMVALVLGQAKGGERAPMEAVRARLRQLLAVVGGPTAASILLGSISAAVVFPVLASLGEDYAAAFLVVMRARIAFMIPAIAVGSVVAILVNQAADDGGPGERIRTVTVGVSTMLALYAGLTFALPYWSGPVLDALLAGSAGDAALRATTELVLLRLQATFFLVAGAAMLQVVLEQLGRGPHVLVVTLLTEAIASAAVAYAAHAGEGVDTVLLVVNGVALAAFCLLLVQLGLLVLRMRRDHAL